VFCIYSKTILFNIGVYIEKSAIVSTFKV